MSKHLTSLGLIFPLVSPLVQSGGCRGCGAVQGKRCKGAQTPESMCESRKRTSGMHFHGISGLNYQGRKSWRVLVFGDGLFRSVG